MSRNRNIWARMWTDFLNSFKVAPRKYFGELKGEDHLGNKYFELPADPQGGRRKSSRWFEGTDPTDTTPVIPDEWMAWLRRQRDIPPTQEEIMINLAKAELKRQNAAKLYEKYGHKDATADPKFRPYPEYKSNPLSKNNEDI